MHDSCTVVVAAKAAIMRSATGLQGLDGRHTRSVLQRADPAAATGKDHPALCLFPDSAVFEKETSP